MASPVEEVLRLVVKTEGASDVGKLAESVIDLGKSGAISEDQMRDFADEIGRISEASKAAKSIIGLKTTLQETGDKLFLAKRGLADLNKEFTQSDRSSASVARAFRQAEKAVADLSKEERTLELQLLKANGVVAKHGLDVEKLAEADKELQARASGAAESLKQFGNESKSAAASTGDLESKTSRVGKAFTSAREGVNNFASGLLRITGIAAGVSAALGALNLSRFFSGAVNSATTFEAALSEVRAVSGATADEIERMRAAAEAASSTTKFSALEAVQAIGELARASGDASQAIEQLPAALNLAQAAGIGAVEAVTILTTATTQFGLSAADSTRIADLFAREANSTQDSVTKLGLAMSYVAPLARQLGIDIEQATAVLGALADQGFKGERAGTALRNVFSQLLDPTSKFRDALNSLGIKGNDFSEIITQLAASGEKGKRALLALDAEARPAIAALVTSGGAGIRKLTEDFKNAAGEAERTAKTMGANFEGASNRLTAAFDFIRRSLVAPILQPLAEQFDEVAIKIRAFAETAQFQRIADSVKTFAVSATEAIIGFVSKIDFEGVTAKVESFAKDAKAFFESVRESGSTFATAMKVVGNTVSLIFNTLQTIVLGVAATLTGLFAVIVKGAALSMEAVSRLNGTFNLMKPQIDALHDAYGGLVAVAEEFGDRANKNGAEAADAFRGLADAVSSAGDTAGKAASDTKPLAEQLKLTSEQAAEAKRQFDALPPQLQKLVEPGLRAAGVFAKLAEDSAKASKGQENVATTLDEAKVAAQRAYQEVAKLAGAGDTTSEAYQRAKVALDAANAILAKVTGQTEAATAAATALGYAQTKLGKSQAELAAGAKQAGEELDLIWQSYLKGGNAIEDVKVSFQRYAEAQRASVANSKEWEKSTVESVLAVKAAALGISDFKPPSLKPLDVKPVTQPLRQLKQDAQEAGDEAGKVGSKAQEGMTSAGQTIASVFAGWLTEFRKTSAAASDEFQKLNAQIFNLGAGVADGIGLVRFAEAVNQASRIVIQRIDDQREGVKKLAFEYGSMSDEAIRALAATRGGVDSVADGFAALADNARDGRSEFHLLGQQDLSGLASSLDSIAARARRVGEEALAAKEKLRGMSDSLQDELDRINGREADIETRRFENQLEEIRKLAEETGTLNSAEYNDALSRAKQLHNEKMRLLEEERKARDKTEKASDTGSSGGRPSSGGSGGGSSAPAPNDRPSGSGRGTSIGGNTYNITVNTAAANAEEIAREVQKIIERINGRSR